MRRALTMLAILALALALAPAQALGAGKKKRVRWVRSVYSDAKGVGFKHPEGIGCSEDSFVVADTGNSRLIRFAYEDDVVTPGETLVIPKSSPLKVQLASDGAVYFLDGRERRIFRLDGEGGRSSELEPRGLPFRSEIVPKSFAIDSRGELYVLDIFSQNVVVLDAAGEYRRRVPFPEEYGFFSDLTVDAQGRIFLLDSVAAVVYSAATGEKKFSRWTEGMKAYMNFPTSLVPDPSGLLYLVDQHGSGLALVGQDGSFLGRELGMGWGEKDLFYPTQICISQGRKIFIADRSNSRIQIFRSSEPSSETSSEQTDAGTAARPGPLRK